MKNPHEELTERGAITVGRVRMKVLVPGNLRIRRVEMGTTDEVQKAIERLDRTATAIMEERDLLRKAVRSMALVMEALERELKELANGQG